MHQQDVRREFAVRRADVRVARRVVEGVHGAVRAVVDHGTGLRHPFRSGRRCAPGDALRLGGPVDVDQPEGGGGFVRGSGEENPRARHVLDRDARAHLEREWAHRAARRIDHDDLVAAVGADRHDASVVQPAVPPGAQHPQRAAGVGVRGREILVVEPGVQAHAPEVPPAGRVVGVEQVVVVQPHRLERRGVAARDGRPLDDDAVFEAADAQLGAIPRHVGVVPGHPGEMPAAR